MSQKGLGRAWPGPFFSSLTGLVPAWELRAIVGDELMRSAVCKTQADVFDTAAVWRAEALQKKWRE